MQVTNRRHFIAAAEPLAQQHNLPSTSETRIAEYPVSGQAGAVRESAWRFANGHRIANYSFLVILPFGIASNAQGVRF